MTWQVERYTVREYEQLTFSDAKQPEEGGDPEPAEDSGMDVIHVWHGGPARDHGDVLEHHESPTTDGHGVCIDRHADGYIHVYWCEPDASGSGVQPDTDRANEHTEGDGDAGPNRDTGPVQTLLPRGEGEGVPVGPDAGPASDPDPTSTVRHSDQLDEPVLPDGRPAPLVVRKDSDKIIQDAVAQIDPFAADIFASEIRLLAKRALSNEHNHDSPYAALVELIVERVVHNIQAHDGNPLTEENEFLHHLFESWMDARELDNVGAGL